MVATWEDLLVITVQLGLVSRRKSAPHLQRGSTESSTGRSGLRRGWFIPSLGRQAQDKVSINTLVATGVWV